MGFYGNITNTAKTQFSFDRVFPNRKEMDKGATTDGIYPGRYVLVEYDTETNLSDFLKVDSIENNRAILNGKKILLGDLVERKDPFVYTAKDPAEEHPVVPTKCKFFICTNYPSIETDYNSKEEAKFAAAVDSDSNYVLNYNIDQKRYKEESRGYDSTVWMKTFSDGVEKYVSIAELNSVVPTFAISADAPTMIPDNPHFDTRSTDVYYELHVQPQWGFRVKEADTKNPDGTTKPDDEIKSDEITIHQVLDPKTGEIINNVEKKADIYYNAAGFNPTQPSVVEDNNYIKIEPTGKSGREYNTHAEGNFEPKVKEDIQELSIHLPAIGNMMSQAWDIIKGPDRKEGSADSLQGRLNFFTEKIQANEIPVQVSGDGNYLIGSKINGNTSFQFDEENKNILDVELSNSMDSDDAWIATKVNTALEEGEEEKYNLNAISIHHTFHPVNDTTSDILEEDREDTIDLYTPYVDQAGHVVGKNIETITLPYTYKTIKTNGRNNNEEINNDIMPEITATTSADNTKDILSIDSGNYWIRTDIENDNITLSHSVRDIDTIEFGISNMNKEPGAEIENNINIPDWTYDNAGHIRSKKNHYYTLPFSFKTIQTNGRADDNKTVENATGEPTTTKIVADNTQDILAINSGNKWIRIDTDAEKDAIVISHDVHNTTSSSKDTDWTKAELNTTIPVITYNYDTAGHYINHHTENYMLPFSYGKIKGDNNTSTEATATYDELKLISGDSWLETEVTTDTVTFTHTGPIGENSENLQKDNLEPTFGDTFKIEDWYFDNKGHKYAGREHTVKIPQGSLTDEGKTESNIITGLVFNQSSGALSTSRTNISELKLDGSQFDSEGIIKITDTLGEALNNLQGHTNRLTTEINTILTREIKRSQDKDTEHTNAINNIYTPATETAAAKGILAEEINRAKKADLQYEDAIEVLQQSVANIYTPATETTEASGYLAEEISRSKEKDDEYGNAIEMLQQSVADIYTPANEETDTPASGILIDKYDGNTEFEWGWGDEQLIETISTPGEQDGVQGQFETKIYSHPTQYETLQNILNEIYLKINNLESKPSNREEVTFIPNIIE